MIPLRLPIWVEGLCATWVGAIRQLSNCSSVAVTASVFCTAAWDVSGDDGWHIEGYWWIRQCGAGKVFAAICWPD